MNSFSLGIQQQAFNLGSSYINKAVSGGRLDRIRKYFQIDNSYLCKKLWLIICPYWKHNWEYRTSGDHGSMCVSNPDLYIPAMGLVTYILLLACELELENKFRPETLGKLTTRNTMLGLLELLCLKGLSFFFDARELGVIDIIAFIGYKYIVAIILKVLHIFLPLILKRLIYLFLMISFVMFLGRSLKYYLINNEPVMSIKKKRVYFLVVFVAIDVLAMVLLK
ncbi:protein transport protein YIF1 [Nematocida sp. AWRm80]|nr:protein transport protein YIF1 [Nematocida sp. AWRm80]